jgi:hypothetical protein
LTFIKEKEMPEFRKWILALAGAALFVGAASAQVGGSPGGGTPSGTVFTCTTTNGAVTPTLRAEGFTELTGDIVITCTGGTPPALGTQIPTANITIFLNTAVTSRLMQSSGNLSEALLLIDEPGSGLTGYGPSLGQTLCVGCGPQFVGTIGANAGVPVSASGATTVGANVFQGAVTGNSVTFFGIPIMPPSSTGLSRVFRITNLRANTNGITAGGPTPGSVVASISISGSTSLPITNSTLTTGFVQQGLSPSSGLKNSINTANASGSGTTFAQCSSVSISNNAAALGTLSYTENFATAFKIRYTPGVIQNIPGTIYNSESGFTLLSSTFSQSGFSSFTTAGVADFGTRLKATFTNVPSGVSLYVTTRDVTNTFVVPGTGAQAQLVVAEGAVDSGVPPATNTPPLATQTSTFGPNNVGIAPVPVSFAASGFGSGAATWEIVSTNAAAIDTVNFGIYINFTASPATNSPSAPSTISVTMSFAPTPSGGLFTASSGALASNSLPIPRFSDSLDITKSLANFALCTTDLLYPYVINTNGFDTGLAIANTTTDPFGTTPQVGTCTLNFYGASAPAAAFVTPSIATGTVYANLASTLAPGFSGYIIAVCNFQYAHGFAFVSDVGARNLAMGYLALIVNNGSPAARGATGEALGN